MSAFLIVVVYGGMGMAAWEISKRLFEKYPLGDRDSGKFRWSKWLPLFGFGLMLVAAGGPPLALVPGALLIFGSTFFLLKKAR